MAEDGARARSRSGSPGAAKTRAQLETASKLRQRMRNQLHKSVSETDMRLGSAAHEDKVKERSLYLENLMKRLDDRLTKTASTRITLRRCVVDIQQQAGKVKASLGICDKRILLRADRPPKELFHADFDDALSEERQVCALVQAILCQRLQEGREFLKPLEEAKVELRSARLTCAFDRTGQTEQLVLKATGLLKSADEFCQASHALMKDMQEQTQIASSATRRRMKEHITEAYNLRWKIEKEMEQTAVTISEAQAYLERTEKQLRISLAMPERKIVEELGGDGKNEELSAKTGVLATLRSKIKSASYTGPGGRNWDVTFGRFDRDASGELDEDEVRMAIRKACKIPPSVIADGEIAHLCQLLDEDASGAIGIAELVDFLLADVDVDYLQEEVTATRITLESLKAAQADSLNDLRDKIGVWRVNEACSKMTPIKGLDLDRSPDMGKPKRKVRRKGAVASKLRQVMMEALSASKLQEIMDEEGVMLESDELAGSARQQPCGSNSEEDARGSLSMGESGTMQASSDMSSDTGSHPFDSTRIQQRTAPLAGSKSQPSLPSRGSARPPAKKLLKSPASRPASANRMMSEDERCMIKSKKRQEHVQKLLQHIMHDGFVGDVVESEPEDFSFSRQPIKGYTGGSYILAPYFEDRQREIREIRTLSNEEEQQRIEDQQRSAEMSMYLDVTMSKRHRRYGNAGGEVPEGDRRRQRFVDASMDEDDKLRKRLQHALRAGAQMQLLES